MPRPSRTQMIPLELEFRQKKHKYFYQIINLQNETSSLEIQSAVFRSEYALLLLYQFQCIYCSTIYRKHVKANWFPRPKHTMYIFKLTSLIKVYFLCTVQTFTSFSTRCFSSMRISYARLCKWKTYDGLGE